MAIPLTITLLLTAPTGPAGLPVAPLGLPLPLVVRFTNQGAQALTTEDPRTSQHLILTLHSHPQRVQTQLEVNPGFLDVTGERTAPPHQTLTLAPGETVTRELALERLCGDRCLLPGWFEVWLELREVASPRLRFGIEYQPATVPQLLQLALDEQGATWSRRQAYRLLQQLPTPPALQPPNPGEPVATAEARRAENQRQAQDYQRQWPELAHQPPFIEFFRRQQLAE